jgi:hypothetical protein
MNPYDIPFVLATFLQQVRKNVQPSQPAEMVNSTDIQGSTPASSAQLAPYYRAPQTDPKLEAIKQAMLLNSNFRDGAKKYFSKIPIVSGELEAAAAGVPADSKIEPYIIVDKKTNMNDKDIVKRILTHELLHTAPQLPTSVLPSNKKRLKEFQGRWENNDTNYIKEEQWAEQALPKILYKYLFK